MKFIKHFLPRIILITICILFVCPPLFSTTLTQDKALKVIQSLPELQQYSAQFKEQGERASIRQEPSDDERSSVEFSVGESHPTHTVIWNRFRIDYANGKVFIFDIESGDFAPIEELKLSV